ncbi:MAG: response regulator transcription factor [Acidobacteriia bacterium]|nr:response regulator transcription factor [Terriglobia bacterium]
MPSHDEHRSEVVTIAVADNTDIHSQLLAEAMRNDRGLQVVASVSGSAELLAAVARVPIDVAVLSYNLDDEAGRGPEVLREMRALRPHIKGVILLNSSQPEDVLDCFRAGAKGIFSKHERLESLCKCIRTVHEGQIWARSVELDLALDALANSPVVRATNHKGVDLLSTRERQVIQALASGKTNREIADSLGLSPHTVKNYLFRIFDKIGVSNRTELLYLTMSNSQSEGENAARKTNGGFSTLVEAAEAGLATAQLQIAERLDQKDHGQFDPVSAYMWYLIAGATTIAMRQRIEEGTQALSKTMSQPELAEAVHRADKWLNDLKSQSTSASIGRAPNQETLTGVPQNDDAGLMPRAVR